MAIKGNNPAGKVGVNEESCFLRATRQIGTHRFGPHTRDYGFDWRIIEFVLTKGNEAVLKCLDACKFAGIEIWGGIRACGGE